MPNAPAASRALGVVSAPESSGIPHAMEAQSRDQQVAFSDGGQFAQICNQSRSHIRISGDNR